MAINGLLTFEELVQPELVTRVILTGYARGRHVPGVHPLPLPVPRVWQQSPLGTEVYRPCKLSVES